MTEKKRAYGPKPTKFTPQNPSKYSGRDIHSITSRSSWELQFMRWADLCPSVISWSSESIMVKYQDMSRLNRDGSPSIHTYYVDFSLVVKKSDGTIDKLWVEVKPSSQCIAPQRGKKSAKVFNEACETYVRNMCKWKAASAAAKAKGFKFTVLTEKNFKTL